MDINITLLGEMITFALFVWFTMRFVWPPIADAMQQREDQIAAGIAKGKQGEANLVQAQEKAAEALREAKDNAAVLLDRANQRADSALSEAKSQSQEEAKRLLDAAREEGKQMLTSAHEQIQHEAVDLAAAMVEKLLLGLDTKQQKARLAKAWEERS